MSPTTIPDFLGGVHSFTTTHSSQLFPDVHGFSQSTLAHDQPSPMEARKACFFWDGIGWIPGPLGPVDALNLLKSVYDKRRFRSPFNTIARIRLPCEFLVGGLEHEFCFPMNLGIIIPTDDSYFSEGLKPPTWFFFKCGWMSSRGMVCTGAYPVLVLLRWWLRPSSYSSTWGCGSTRFSGLTI